MLKPCRVNGFDNILIEDKELIHNVYNPFNEARGILRSIDAGSDDLIVLYGNGAGYLLETAFKEFGVRNFIIFEPNGIIISLALKRAGVAAAVEDKFCNAYFFVPDNFDASLILGILLSAYDKKIKSIEMPYFSRIDKVFLEKCKMVIAEKTTKKEKFVSFVYDLLQKNMLEENLLYQTARKLINVNFEQVNECERH